MYSLHLKVFPLNIHTRGCCHREVKVLFLAVIPVSKTCSVTITHAGYTVSNPSSGITYQKRFNPPRPL
jgi:hypothetical protein